MVLLPKIPSPREKNEDITRNTFFEDDRLDYMAKFFVGNNNRFVSSGVTHIIGPKEMNT